jgi:hypothetical protein
MRDSSSHDRSVRRGDPTIVCARTCRALLLSRRHSVVSASMRDSRGVERAARGPLALFCDRCIADIGDDAGAMARAIGICGGLISAVQAVIVLVWSVPLLGDVVDLGGAALQGAPQVNLDGGAFDACCGVFLLVVLVVFAVLFLVVIALVLALLFMLFGAAVAALRGRPEWLAAAAGSNALVATTFAILFLGVEPRPWELAGMAGGAALAATLCSTSAFLMWRARKAHAPEPAAR